MVLKLLREFLPEDLQLCLPEESAASQHESLQQALGKIREEASEKARRLQEVLEEGDAGPPEEGEEGVAPRGVKGEGRRVTPTQCDPRLEMATDAALALIHE